VAAGAAADGCHLDDLAVNQLDVVFPGQDPGLDHALILGDAPEPPRSLDLDRHRPRIRPPPWPPVKTYPFNDSGSGAAQLDTPSIRAHSPANGSRQAVRPAGERP
jgi:hypothetical protein